MCRRPGLFVIGLTGGLASGKSTVSAMLKNLGAITIDADELVREVQAPGTQGQRLIQRAFGDSVVKDDGTLDRRRLASLVFSDKDARARLEGIVHPLVIGRIEEELAHLLGCPPHGIWKIAVVDAPLLLEAGLDSLVDEVWVVASSREEQVRRAVLRDGYSPQEAQSRIDAQMPLEEKIERATRVIDNGGTVAHTQEQVFSLWKDIDRKLASQPRTTHPH